MSKILEEKKNELITRAEDVLNLAKGEERELTDAEAQEVREIRDEVNRINETLKLEDDFSGFEKKEETQTREETMETREYKVGNDSINVRDDEYKAFESFIRAERDTDTNMTKGANGAVIPTTIVNWIIRKVYDICPILERSQRFNTKGKVEVPYYPYDSENINVAYAEEFSDLVSTAGKFGSVELTGFLAGALTKISKSLINNTDIDIVAFVVDEMARAFKRFIEHELLIGTPASSGVSAKVLGLSTITNGVTTASPTAITADELIDLQDSIKDEFQQDAIWIMSSQTRTAIRKLKDNYGRYLLQDDITQPFGRSLLGKPVYVSDNMPDIGDGGNIIYYGDMRGLGTKFSENLEVQILRELFATQHAEACVGWIEFDGKVIDAQQIVRLTMGVGSV